MKKLLVLLLVSVFVFRGMSQTAAPLIITPGVGIGQLKLGMSEQQALIALHMPDDNIAWSGYNEQMEKFVGWDIAVDSTVQFILGFDTCARFEGKVSDVMPVFALYFKNHKLNFITVSSYVGEDSLVKRVKVNNGIIFYNEMSAVVAKMGKDYMNISPGDNTADMFYYKKGIELVIDAGEVRSIGIFSPLPNFKALIASNSERLQKEASRYSKENSLLEKIGQ